MSACVHPETNRIVLHGRLEQMFGGPFDLGIASPLDAVRALCVMMQGFRQALSVGAYRVIYGPLDSGMELDIHQLELRLGHGNEVHIVPEAAGSGSGRGASVGKIILGIALIALAIWVMPAAGIAIGATGLAISPSAVAMFGVALILQGVSSFFAPKPEKARREESFLISGAVNSVGQGEPVPLCYGGPIRAGSTVISLSYTVAEIPLNSFGQGGNSPGKSK